MALYGVNLELVPIYLESDSKDELVRLMVINNQLNGQKFNYMSPMLENNMWVVWFFADIKEWQDPNELSEEEIVAVGALSK
ncbi:MAG: hypothetical protein HRT70_01315 [Flavobacteriaceae bacterium]|nr:hypothetical protein [Flavobacteriaceae bacterium]